ncbi:MAG: hypothetical protein C4549_06815 [Deltaproteobacteria bacterium]|jgi:hypothetical protein|nr:MAG: hypothetical protein C4549_06815 [Deltaproteobacteria bacterium]
MTKDSRVYLVQILERIERIIQYTATGRNTFFSDPLIQDAVIRNFRFLFLQFSRRLIRSKRSLPAMKKQANKRK